MRYLKVIAADQFDPARVVGELRRVRIKLDTPGDKVLPTRRTHAFLEALPDEHYGSSKTVLLCEKPNDGGAALGVGDIANRPTSHHAMQIRWNVCVHGDGTGRHGRALNTVMHGGAREFRMQGERGQGRSNRGNGGSAANGNTRSLNSYNHNHGVNSNGNSLAGKCAGNAEGARGTDRGNQASGRGHARDQDNGQSRKG